MLRQALKKQLFCGLIDKIILEFALSFRFTALVNLLIAACGLATTASYGQGETGGSVEEQAPRFAENQDSEAINHYYHEECTPVVTNHPPPDPYYDLYSWVAYSFWYTGPYFPGYFILNIFHRREVNLQSRHKPQSFRQQNLRTRNERIVPGIFD